MKVRKGHYIIGYNFQATQNLPLGGLGSYSFYLAWDTEPDEFIDKVTQYVKNNLEYEATVAILAVSKIT